MDTILPENLSSIDILRIYMVHQQTHVRYYIRIREQLTCSAYISCRSTQYSVLMYSVYVLDRQIYVISAISQSFT